MSRLVRLAGWGSLPDGGQVTWTISEGRRGRRWREVIADGQAVRHALLLETDRDGRFSHLESASAAGLWTLHPEGDGTLHGNHVDPHEPGVRHVTGWSFGADDAVFVAGSPLAAAAVVWQLRDVVRPGSEVACAGVWLGPDGRLAQEPAVRIERHSDAAWRIAPGEPFAITDAGAPVLDGGGTSDLELG